MMVRYLGSHMKHGDIGDARELIHKGKIHDLGCLMLGKNRLENLIDKDKLNKDKVSYLISLRDGFLPIHHGVAFYIEPYSPHRFSRQFGFYHGILGMLLGDPRTQAVSYEDALRY